MGVSMGPLCMFLMLALVPSLASPFSTWPYLQVYPPVNESDGRAHLYFALTLSFGGDFPSVAALPGVQIALDYINSEPSILPGYTLHYTLTDSQCNKTVAIDSFFREMTRAPTKIGYIGSGCSVATEPAAELSQFFNITHLSCTSALHAADLNYYFQLRSSSAVLSRGFFAIIKAFKWKRVFMLTQNELVFVKMADLLKKYLASAGIEYMERVFSSSEGIRGLGDDPFDMDSRVYILAMYSPHARALACKAYKKGLHYPTHQFLLLGWYRDNWLVESVSDSGGSSRLNCSLEERWHTFQYAMLVRELDFNTDKNVLTEGGLTLREFERQHLEKVQDPVNSDLGLSTLLQGDKIYLYSEQCHEATLTLAKALHLVSEDLSDTNQTLNIEAGTEAGLSEGEGFTLANFSYSNSVIVQRMFHHLSSTDFIGITGRRVRFNKNRTRPISTLVIQQYHPAGDNAGSLERVEIGTVPVDKAVFSYASDVSQSDIFPKGVPSDGVPEAAKVTVAVPITVLFSIFAVAVICFALMCLIFNFMCRAKKLMIVSGTCLNYLIGLGSILQLLGVMMDVLPLRGETETAALCNLVKCLENVGFSLTNGTVAMKIIRIWFIHNRPKLSKKITIRDSHIFIAVMVLVVIDLIITGLYLLIAGLKGELEATLIRNRENPTDFIGETRKVIENYFYVCSGTGPRVLFPILIGIKAFLLVVALVFSLRTQKMKDKHQDDSKYIAALVYIMNVVSVVIVISNVTLVEFLNTQLVILCLSYIVGNAAVLGFVFVPKMVGIYRDPNGENVIVSGKGVGGCHQYTITSHDERELEGLRQRVKQLQDTLKEYGNEIQEDDENDDDEPQKKVIIQGRGTADVLTSEDTGIDVRSVPNSHVSRIFVTDGVDDRNML